MGLALGSTYSLLTWGSRPLQGDRAASGLAPSPRRPPPPVSEWQLLGVRGEEGAKDEVPLRFHLPYLPRPPKVHFPTGDSSPLPSPDNP